MKNVEDLFPLSPMQKMMLLHTVTAPDSDVLFNQFCYEIEGEVDSDAFRGAWQWLVDSHPALRAVYLWDNLKEPMQAIRKQVELPFESYQLDDLPDAERKARLDALIARDRSQPFDPARAPLMRVSLVRLAETSYFLIWSSHHLLLDRWCLPVVFDGVGRAYEQIRDRGAPPTDRRLSFRSYVGWIQQQDASAARDYWRRTLAGFRATTSFQAGATESKQVTAGAHLAEATSHQARALARTHRVTLSCVFQGALALALARHCETRDVVFGSTVSGRPPELDGVESIIGSFVNNVPSRVRLPSDERIGSWLQNIQRHQQERQAFDYVARSDIEASSELSAGESIFDTLFVWLASVPPTTVNGFRLRGVPGQVRTGYPVTISITDETPSLRLDVSADHGGADTILGALTKSLDALLQHGDGRLADVLTLQRERSSDRARPFEATEGKVSPLPGRAVLDDVSRIAYSEHAALSNMLLKECRTLLRTNAFEAGDSFFESGGNSVQAVRLHAKLESLTGRTIPLLELFKNPSVEQMAKATIDDRWPAQEQVARALRDVGDAPALFCVGAPGVRTIGYVALMEQLSPERPVYVLQSPAGPGGIAAFTIEQVDELAERYLAAMQEVAPRGPYNLLSMCGGAHVAVEMARRLANSGERVDFVGLVNTWSFYTVSWKVHLWRLWTRYWYYRRRLGELGLRGAVAKLSPFSNEPVDANVASTRPKGRDAADSSPDEGDDVEWWKLARRRRREPPKRYDGTIHVFRLKKQQFFRVNDVHLGWSDYARRIELHHLSTTMHLDIMRGQGLEELARMLEHCMQAPESA